MTNQNARPDRMPIARIQLGAAEHMVVAVYGATAAELGVPLVELAGALEHLQHLTPAQADEIAAALTLAARQARGEAMPPTELDRLLESRNNSRTAAPAPVKYWKSGQKMPPG